VVEKERHVMCRKVARDAHKESLKERNHAEDIGLDWKAVLNWILRKQL
jgi:hypothetical protein